MCHLFFSWGIHLRNFKTVACTVLKLCYASKSVTNGRTDERPRGNMPLQLLRSWVHKNSIKTTCTSVDPGENMCKFQKDMYKIVWGVAITRYLTVYTSEVRKPQSSQSRKKVTKINARIISKAHALKWQSSQCGKRDKNDLTIISKPHAHPPTMKKTHAKFQNDRYKTVIGVALTRGTHCLYIDGEKY